MPVKLSCRVVSQGRRIAATGATLLSPGVGKEAGSCLQCPILMSCGGTAIQVVPRGSPGSEEQDFPKSLTSINA